MKKTLDNNDEKVYTLQHEDFVVKNTTSKPRGARFVAIQKAFQLFFNCFTFTTPKEGTSMNKSKNWAKALLSVAALAAAALLTACGGGGSDPAETPQKTISSAISVSKSLKASDFDLTSPVAVDAKLTSSFTTSGDVGTVTAVVKGLVCDGTPVTVTAAVTSGKVSYTTSGNLPFGASCTLGVKLTGSTASANGNLPSDEASYAFTTVAAPKVFHYTNLVLTVFADGTLGRIIPDATAASGYRSLALVNKTVYQTGAFHVLALCATVWDGTVMHKEINGAPVVSCVTPAVGNLRRFFDVNPETNEIGAEVPEPSGVILRDVAFGPSLYEAQGIGAGSFYAIFGSDVVYITNTDDVHLRLAPGGNFSKSVVVSDSDGHEGYKSMWSVSN